jgi:SulP family sulfate permease
MFRPKLFETMKGYSKDQFSNDLVAGILVGIIAIPLSIALAISSGVTPQQGLLTAIIAGFVVSFFGGSRVQIGGPTGAFVVIIYGIIVNFGYSGLVVATLMAGILLIIMGILKFGTIIRYIPCTITTGFTSGIAVVIFSQQINDFLGLEIKKIPAEFYDKIHSIIINMNHLNIYSLLTGALALAIIIVWPKINKRIPGALIAILVTSVLSIVFDFPIETIGSRFPTLSAALPKFAMPVIDVSQLSSLIGPAFTIAILAGIESLMSAVVTDKLVIDKHDSNTELIAQGMANIASVLFGGIPATGALARSAANVKNGGRTPVAGIVHSITVLVIMLLLIPFAKMIPMTTLAAILIVVAYNMSEWRVFKALLKTHPADIMVLVITFLLTVFLDLVVAIEIGMLLAVVVFMVSMANKSKVVLNKDLSTAEIKVLSVNGPFFFAASDHFAEYIKIHCKGARIVILSLENSYHMDATGIGALVSIVEFCKLSGIKLLLTDTKEDIQILFEKTEFVALVGEHNMYDSVTDALASVTG